MQHYSSVTLHFSPKTQFQRLKENNFHKIQILAPKKISWVIMPYNNSTYWFWKTWMKKSSSNRSIQRNMGFDLERAQLFYFYFFDPFWTALHCKIFNQSMKGLCPRDMQCTLHYSVLHTTVFNWISMHFTLFICSIQCSLPCAVYCAVQYAVECAVYYSVLVYKIVSGTAIQYSVLYFLQYS